MSQNQKVIESLREQIETLKNNVKKLSDENSILTTTLQELEENWGCVVYRDHQYITVKSHPKYWVYCMSNPSMEGIYKIGMTKRSPEERLKEANSADTFRPPTPYEILCSVQTTDAVKKEKQLHKILSEYRVSENREFFKVEKQRIIELFNLIRVEKIYAYDDRIEEDNESCQ